MESNGANLKSLLAIDNHAMSESGFLQCISQSPVYNDCENIFVDSIDDTLSDTDDEFHDCEEDVSLNAEAHTYTEVAIKEEEEINPLLVAARRLVLVSFAIGHIEINLARKSSCGTFKVSVGRVGMRDLRLTLNKRVMDFSVKINLGSLYILNSSINGAPFYLLRTSYSDGDDVSATYVKNSLDIIPPEKSDSESSFIEVCPTPFTHITHTPTHPHAHTHSLSLLPLPLSRSLHSTHPLDL